MPKKGYKQTPEHRAKVSVRHRGLRHTPEARAKMSVALKGRKFTPEHRAKLGVSRRGIKLSPEHRAKLSAALAGRKRSPEIRERLRGEKNGNWKGGRIIAGLGYIGLLRPSHPFANSKGYVMEHRLVMEAHIGRVLLPTEIVHHVNGDPSDNRIENLMLFSTETDHKVHHKILRSQKGGKS